MGLKDRLTGSKTIKAIQEPVNRVGVVALVGLILAVMAFLIALGVADQVSGKANASN